MGFFVFGFLLLVIALNIVAALGGLILAEQAQPGMGGAERQDWLDRHGIDLQMAMSFPLFLGSLGLVAFFRRYLDKRPVRSLGFAAAPPAEWALGVALGCGLIAGCVAVLGLSGSASFAPGQPELRLLLLVPAVALMAFTEELVCRGYLLQNLLDVERPLSGIVVSSVLFWLFHSLNPAAWSSPIVPLNLFGAGVLLALAYRLTGTLWFATALHFGWNLSQGVLFGVPVSGLRVPSLIDCTIDPEAPRWLTGGDFGLEGSLLCTVAELALIWGFARRLSRSSAPPEETEAAPG